MNGTATPLGLEYCKDPSNSTGRRVELDVALAKNKQTHSDYACSFGSLLLTEHSTYGICITGWFEVSM